MRVEQEPAVTGQGHHRFVRLGYLGAQGNRVSVAKVTGVGRCNEGAGFVNGIVSAAVVAHLGHACDEDAVFRHGVADRIEVRVLWLYPGSRLSTCRLEPVYLRLAAGLGRHGSRQGVVQPGQSKPGVALDAQGVVVVTAQFFRVDVDLHYALPVDELGVLYSGPYGQNHVVAVVVLPKGVVAQPHCAQGQGMMVGNSASPLGSSQHRGLQEFGDPDEFPGRPGGDYTAPDENHR